MEIDRRTMEPGQVVLSVGVDPTFPAISALDLIVGSSVPFGDFDPTEEVFLPFQYSSEAISIFTGSQSPADAGVGYYSPPYPNSLFLGGNRNNNFTVSNFILGNLALDLTDLKDGEYEVWVDARRDEDQSIFYNIAGSTDSLTTTPTDVATIRIVPEPATLALLGLGAFAAFWRKRQSGIVA
jgi:hypothetical protein